MAHTYNDNAADQMEGRQYDAAGNRLLTTTSKGQSRTNPYNGDDVLVEQTANGTATRYSNR